MSWKKPNCELHFEGWSAILVSVWIIVAGVSAIARGLLWIMGQ